MRAEIDRELARRLKDFSMQYPHGSYAEIIDKLAFESGCMPNLDNMEATNARLFDKFWRNTILSIHFQYEDESKREKSEAVIDRCDEFLNRTFQLDVDEHSGHNAIFSEAFKKFTQAYTLPKGLFKYLVKSE